MILIILFPGVKMVTLETRKDSRANRLDVKSATVVVTLTPTLLDRVILKLENV